MLTSAVSYSAPKNFVPTSTDKYRLVANRLVVFWWYGFHIKAGAVEAGDKRTHQWLGRLSGALQSLLPLRDPPRCCHRLRRSGAEAISVPALHPLSGRIRLLRCSDLEKMMTSAVEL